MPTDGPKKLETAMKRIDPTSIPSTHPVNRFRGYYAGLVRPGAAVPPWAAFDPIDVPRLLTYLSIMVYDGTTAENIRQVVVGENQLDMIGRQKIVNKRLGDVLSEPHRHERLRSLMDVIHSRSASYHEAVMPYSEYDYISIYRGAFPFSENDLPVGRIVLCVAKANART